MSTHTETLHRSTTAVAASEEPVTGWRRLLADWTVVGSATLFCHALGAGTSLLLRMLLSPTQMGIWAAMKMLMGYGNYANLGISKGATRELAVATGSGRMAEARHGLNLAFTINTLSSFCYASVLVGVALWIHQSGETKDQLANKWTLGLITVAIMAVLGRYVTFHVTILRTVQQFSITSRLAVLEAVLTLAICGPAAWIWGLAGLYAGTLTVLVGSLVYLVPHAAARLRPSWDPAEIRRLVGIGAPILLAGTISTLFRSLDKLMILAYLDDREFQLGCYSVTLMVTTQLYGLANMLSVVMAPRYGEKFGRTNDRRAVARLAARASELHAAAMALPAAITIVAAPPFLSWLLPDYHLGLAPLVWLVPGVIVLTLTLPCSQFLVAVGRQQRVLVTILITTGLAALANHVVLQSGYGLVGVAAATAGAYTMYFLLILAVSLWRELNWLERLKYVGMMALLLGPTLTTAVWLRCDMASRAPFGTNGSEYLLVKIGLIAPIWTATLAIAWRTGGWRAELR